MVNPAAAEALEIVVLEFHGQVGGKEDSFEIVFGDLFQETDKIGMHSRFEEAGDTEPGNRGQR